MPRFDDWDNCSEVQDIVEKYVEKFPLIFEGFKVDKIFFILTKTKRIQGKFPIKVTTVPYPHYVYGGYAYCFNTYETKWDKFNQKQKHLAVFHAMCAIPVGGFDPLSNYYGKKVKPDYEMYAYEFAVSGGVPNWQENDSARDPMDVVQDDIPVAKDEDEEDPIPAPSKSNKTPATAESIATVIMDDDTEAVAS
jgi:hypothetical protein